MQRYSHLLKQKDKALGIFEKVRVKLSEVHEALQNEETNLVDRVHTLNEQIKDELKAQEFLQNERKAVSDKIQKIANLLG